MAVLPGTSVTTSLLGRSAELEQLRAAVHAPERHDGSVLVVGEPGIGKSALLGVVRDLAHASGALVLTAQGAEVERDLPFAGLQQLLAPLRNHSSRLPEVQRAAVESALGVAASVPPRLFLVGLASLGLLSEVAAERHVVVLVDDLSWIDPSTQVVLAFLARRLADHRVVLVTAARTGYDGALAGLGQLLELPPLAPGDAEQLLRRVDATITARTRDYVLAQARGNPLALIELPTYLPRTFRVDAAEAETSHLPSRRLTQAFAGRLPALPAATRDAVLVAAAHPGTDVALLLTAASSLSGVPVTVADLDPAVSAGLLDLTGSQVLFHHPLTRAAVLTVETASRRQRAHAALAAAVRHDPLAHAWHCAHATPTRDDEVADELAAVTPLALSRGSLADAVRCLERSAELTSDPRRRGQRYVAAAAESVGLGDVDTSAGLVARAAELPLSSHDRLVLDWVREVVDEEERGHAHRVRWLCQLAGEAAALGDAGLALDLLFAAALRCLRSAAEAATRRTVLDGIRRHSDQRDDPRFVAALAVADPSSQAAAGLLRRFDQVPSSDTRSLRALGFAARAVGDSPGAVDYLRRAEIELRRQGAVGHLVQVLLTQVPHLLAIGEWSRAERAIDEARQYRDETDRTGSDIELLVCDAHAAGLRGDLGPALALAERAERLASDRGVTTPEVELSLARGCAWAGVGRFPEAYEELRHLFEALVPDQPVWPRYPALMFFAEAAVHSGQRRDAIATIDSWAARDATTPAPDLLVHLRYARAVLAEPDDSERLYTTALDGDLGNWPFVRAMLASAYGAWLRRERRMVESRRLTRSALRTFDLIGARGWAARARSELAAAGERQETTGQPLADVLSPQQLQVAQLAARGLSNREIGERLFLSPRTVGSHLYRIFPKLGVTSRIHLVHRLNDATLEPAVLEPAQ